MLRIKSEVSRASLIPGKDALVEMSIGGLLLVLEETYLSHCRLLEMRTLFMENAFREYGTEA